MSTQKVRPDLGFPERQEFRQRRRMRNRKIGTYALVAAMVAVAGFAVSTQLGDPDVRQPAAPTGPSSAPVTITHQYVDITTGERSSVPMRLAGADPVEVSPNREAFVYVAPKEECCGGGYGVFVANLDGSGTEMITPAELDGDGPTWIDDETILFQGWATGTREPGDLYVADLSTGEVTMVTDLPDERNARFVQPDVSPDGTTVLFHLSRGQNGDAEYDLWTAPLAGGEPTLLRKDAGFAEYAGGGSIVFFDHPIPPEGAIWIMDGDGSNARPLVERQGTPRWRTWVSPDGTKVAYRLGVDVEWVDIESGEVTTLDELDQDPVWYGNDKLIVLV